MGQFNIFPNSTQFPVPVYPVLAIIYCLALYFALLKFNLHKIIQKLFALAINLPYVQKTLVYLFLINFPLIALSTISLAYDGSLIGFLISCDVDHIQIILVSGYICYIQQSRQTPIRGFLFIRDLVIAICSIGCLLKFHLDGHLQIEYGIILLLFYLAYFFSQYCEEKIENGTLKILGLKESNAYNAKFLKTQTRKEANYLKIKSLIEQNKQKIKNDIEEFSQRMDKIYASQDQKHILINFAKLILPYKNALQFDQQKQVTNNIQKICEDWIENGNQISNDEEEEDEDQKNEKDMNHNNGQNRSAACLLYNRTLTDDFVVEDYQMLQVEESTFGKIIRYSFYPLYLISTAQGRIRSFLDYLCVVILIAAMWMIATSCEYFAKHTYHYSYGIISLIIAISISLPSGIYYLRISNVKDFDFINIFLQSSVIKSVIFGIIITVISLINSQKKSVGSTGLIISAIINLVTYCIYGGFMIAQKFATLKSNLTFFIGLSVSSFIVKIIVELSYNVANGMNKSD